jgi:arginyl-tRNA synthetase
MQDIGLKAGTAIIRDRTGATTYLLRDLAAVLERSRKYDFDRMIIVAANDNGVHFTHVNQILKALDMGDLADKVSHLRFNESSKMGEKLGKGYRPQDIIAHCEEAMQAALETDEEKAAVFKGPIEGGKALGIAALLAQELSTRTNSAHAFDTSTMTAFKLGTGPDLQYWYAKLCSILKEQPKKAGLADEDYESFVADEPANLLRILAQYPEVTHAAYQSLESAVITTYLASVTELLTDCLSEDEEEEGGEAGPAGDAEAEAPKPEGNTETGTNKAAKEPKTFAPGHLLLFEATRVVLENGMKLLGIVPYATSEPDRADTPIAE